MVKRKPLNNFGTNNDDAPKISRYFKPTSNKSINHSSRIIEIIDIDSSSSVESIIVEGDDEQGNLTKSKISYSHDVTKIYKDKVRECNLENKTNDIIDDANLPVQDDDEQGNLTKSKISFSHDATKINKDEIGECNLENKSYDIIDDASASSKNNNPFESFKFQRNSKPCKYQIVQEDAKKSTLNSKKDTTVPTEEKETTMFSTLTPYELEKVRLKWHMFSNLNDPTLENKRFQILVAARLHARAHEQVVHRAMKVLLNLFESENKSFCVKEMSEADPEKIANAIPFVHFANSKASQIVKAAKEIHCQFDGNVPESKTDLKKITGIGVKLAHILSVVNTLEAHVQLDKR